MNEPGDTRMCPWCIARVAPNTDLMFRKIIYLLTTLHLLVVTLVIFRVLDNKKIYQAVERPFAILTALNYSAWRFAFFTPDVGKSTEVDILLENAAGKKIHYSTLQGFEFFTHNWEAANRFYGYKVHSARDSVFIDLSARSACTYLLNEHPEMNKITYTMRGIKYPDMREYRQDKKVEMGTFYQVQFGL
jgi:hypothetical protein